MLASAIVVAGEKGGQLVVFLLLKRGSNSQSLDHSSAKTDKEKKIFAQQKTSTTTKTKTKKTTVPKPAAPARAAESRGVEISVAPSSFKKAMTCVIF